MGIDPGTIVLGYGIIAESGSSYRMLDCGTIRVGKMDDHALRLKGIHDGLQELVDLHLPDELAIEAPFYGKNVQSMLKLGRAQGVAIASALSRGIPFQEYAPRRIKQAITGNGSASKEQVASMVQNILGLKELPKALDATDGLATALCHAFSKGQGNMGGNKKGSKGSWTAFVQSNPGRVKD